MNRFAQPQINNNFAAANDHITRINDINPFNANNITLKVKVETKNAVRNYTNAKGEGKMFSVDLVDDSGEIKCTLFNETVDQYEHVFEVGKVFIISRSGIKPGNPKFCRTPFEMSINRGTVITEVEGDVINTPKRRYNFIGSIDQIQDLPVQSSVEVIGVIISVGDVLQFNSKNDGKEVIKRSVRIADQSNRNIDITIWGEPGRNFEGEVGAVLALKGAKVGEYKGEKNLTAGSSTQIELNPEVPENQTLAEWYSQNSESIASSSIGLSGQGGGSTQRITKIETLSSLQEQISSGEKKSVIGKIKGTLMWINHDDRAPLFYKACLDNQKKVVENPNPGNGKRWLCEATGQYYDNYDCRYILSCVVGDTTGSQFVTIFNDQGVTLLGVQAKEIESYKEQGNSTEMNRIFDAAIFKRYFFVIKATEEMYQDEMKIRCIVSSMEPIDYVVESKRLLDEIDTMLY
jgi:replication factor A1